MCWQWCKVTLRPCGRCCWVGWGLRGPRSFSFDGKQLSYPITHYYDSYLPSLPCPIKAGWKTSGHHGNSTESVATPWKSETRVWLSSVRITIPGTVVVLGEVLLSHDKNHLHRAYSASASQFVKYCTWTHIRWNGSPWQPALWIPQPQGQTCCLSGTVSPTLSVALRDKRRTVKTQWGNCKMLFCFGF